jgi:hypothetical protein
VFHNVRDAAEHLPDSMRNKLSLILAVTTEAPIADQDKLVKRLHALIGVTSFHVEVQFFNLEELENEFNLAGCPSAIGTPSPCQP